MKVRDYPVIEVNDSPASTGSDKEVTIVESPLSLFIVSDVIDNKMLVLKSFGNDALTYINEINKIFKNLKVINFKL